MPKRKSFNWRARQVLPVIVDNTESANIQVEDAHPNEHYDAANPLVLPSAKRKTRVQKPPTANERILSKKQRKRLEKVVAKKKKRENREVLLDELAQVQAEPAELKSMISIAQVQTKGLKRHFHELKFGVKEANRNTSHESDEEIHKSSAQTRINAIKGAKRLRCETISSTQENQNDPNIVGFSDESKSDTEDEEATQQVAPSIKPPQNTKPATFVHVARSPEIQNARMQLPILGEEQQIMETISEHDIIIIAGETGSGKTTQLPQFLYEAGYALNDRIIGITEPRRVAAIAMAQRVATEMSLDSTTVSFLIRFAGSVSDATRIKFMTDGVLIREIQRDFLLAKYSVIILDEAHERSTNTDILIGLLSRLVPLRRKHNNPLKLIIMSATLRLEDFTHNQRLFPTPPPVINIATRQFKVAIHFSKRTPQNYLHAAFAKACRVHARLPEGGILIFVTGQQEVKALAKKLRSRYPFQSCTGLQTQVKSRGKLLLPKINLDEYKLTEEDSNNFDSEHSDEEVDCEEMINEDSALESKQALWVLPLYALLSSEEQGRVFQPPPDGSRLCVIATNVAETSLTIPGVKYVIDTGKTKTKLYDKVTGANSYVVGWTSRASAAQRAGRAGRTASGHCYRLYSSAVFQNDFAEFAVPDIQRRPIDDLYLQMKCMHIHTICNFPFPSAPDRMQLKWAEKRLSVLGALSEGGAVTAMGRAIARFPVLPRYGKMLALSHQFDLLPYTICMVAALSVQEPRSEGWKSKPLAQMLGDPMDLLKAVGGVEFVCRGRDEVVEEACAVCGMRVKAFLEIRKLRKQLTNVINANVEGCKLSDSMMMMPPTEDQSRLLCQIILTGMGDQVARKVPAEGKPQLKYAYWAMNMEDMVFMHRDCVLKRAMPEYVVYQEIYETNRMYMRGVTAIEVEWLPKYVPALCQMSEPLNDPEPIGIVKCFVKGSFGAQNWEIPQCQIKYTGCLGAFKWFARFFLEGKVVPELGRYAKSLLSAPTTMVKSWARLQPRTDALLKALMSANCSSREDLIQRWESDPKFLLAEYLLWLPSSAHDEVSQLWARLIQSNI